MAGMFAIIYDKVNVFYQKKDRHVYCLFLKIQTP